ncbi:MAG: TetR/AcrR family transcriptional regulator [Phenylobacterium sp.]|uniref:TetR/AcrR family transcriptional regulator n=1 Tax=Phenylobacterium sp. TaxID=1871053 RepID=UPI00271C6329|nr:TetR/AcrR family transcriptional regulator [Phenylobacterium sp.]MDO8410713.1 TetR/AcrR family transcriptional regulator [Phenylobacterium sp.]
MDWILKIDYIPNMQNAVTSSLSLRDRGKVRRHAEIVAAATKLWRERGFENVALAEIAAAAEVSPQTVYNLIGGLDAICFAVIQQALEQLDAVLEDTSATGVEFALEAARISADLYIADARLYRQLLARVPRMLFQGTHLGRDVVQIVIQAVAEAQTANQVSPAVDPVRLGRAIYSAYLGALYDWACGDSDNAGFREEAQIAVLAPLAACATDAAKPALTARLFDHLSSTGERSR